MLTNNANGFAMTLCWPFFRVELSDKDTVMILFHLNFEVRGEGNKRAFKNAT